MAELGLHVRDANKLGCQLFWINELQILLLLLQNINEVVNGTIRLFNNATISPPLLLHALSAVAITHTNVSAESAWRRRGGEIVALSQNSTIPPRDNLPAKV